MNWMQYSYLKGKHALFSPSNYHWIGYSPEKVVTYYDNSKAKQLGTELHSFAEDAIRHKIFLEENGSTLSMYVNDCIRDGMDPEVVLYYSDNFFGTADGIAFDEETSLLRIYDLKTGKTPASMKQLWVYSSLFCLQHGYEPHDIDIHLRIYQNNNIVSENPDPDIIWGIVDKIILFDNLIEDYKRKG